MIGVWLFCGVLMGWNGALVRSSILSSALKDEGSLGIFKDPTNQLEYVLKRNEGEVRAEADSKERRSNMGASFIRFGRSGGDPSGFPDLRDVAGESNPQVSRHPRFKSPDIVIRFGRSGLKALGPQRLLKRARNDLNFIRFGRGAQLVPAEVDLTALCSEALSGEKSPERNLSRLLGLCGFLEAIEEERGFGLEEDRQAARRE